MTRVRVMRFGLATRATPLFANYTAQKNYFNAISANASILDVETNYVPGKPLLVPWDPAEISQESKIAQADLAIVEYKGREYYYNVLDYSFVSEGLVELAIELDPWLTYKAQNSLTLGHGHLKRSHVEPKFHKDIDCPKWVPTGIAVTEGGRCVLCCFLNGEEQEAVRYGFKMFSDSDAPKIMDGSWIYELGLQPDKVLGAWYFVGTAGSLDPSAWEMKQNSWFVATFPLFLAKTLHAGTIKSTTITKCIIYDPMGYVWHTIENDQEWNGVKYTLTMTSDSAKMIVYDGTMSNYTDALRCGRAIFISLMNIPVIYDEWTIYKSGSRQVDIEMYRFNAQRQFTQNMTQGALGGAMTGALTGNIQAGLAATIMGPVMAFAQYQMDMAAQPKIQQLTDQQYRNKSDSLAMATSDVAIAIYYGFGYGIAFLNMSPDSRNRYFNDVKFRGFEWDECIENGETQMRVDPNYAPIPDQRSFIQGEFTINGNAPLSIKLAIRTKVEQGVMIEKLGAW